MKKTSFNFDSCGYPLSNRSVWHPLGDNPGNYNLIGACADDATPALIEKIVNSIDAVLLGECHAAGIVPDSDLALSTMQKAVEQFFAIKDGRIGVLDNSEVRELANRIHMVATGSKMSPCYLVIDNGEGQTPNRFKETFLSTTRQSTKIRIRSVRGQYNAGGTATLPFCGKHNMQLIISALAQCACRTIRFFSIAMGIYRRSTSASGNGKRQDIRI
ncbi:MAG: hypothetical protein MZV70_63340 [Desulfobacterales bacterium]|nr:hypothetical protein [Desulfobacterales bacterium]